MHTKKKAYIVLLILTVIVLVIYLYQNTEHFYTQSTTTKSAQQTAHQTAQQPTQQPLINIPSGDIHFIRDNNPSLINTPILNYKLKLNGQNSKYITVFMHESYQYMNTKYTALGQYVRVTDEPIDITKTDILEDLLKKKCLNYLTASIYYPVDYNLIWTSDTNSNGQIFSVWRPIAPLGMMALGDVIVNGTSKPIKEYITCLPVSMLEFAGLSNGILWHSINDMGKDCFCWGVGNFDTYRATNIYNPNIPELKMVYNITQKTLENNTLNTIPTQQGGNGIQV
jgi:ABC-type cobalt transport system substrate-binding protein